MDMGMEPELLIPGMQHGEEADFRAEVFRVASDFEKSFCTGAEQQAGKWVLKPEMTCSALLHAKRIKGGH